MSMFDIVEVLLGSTIRAGTYQIKTFKPAQNEKFYLGVRGGMEYLCKDERLNEVVPYNGDMLMVGEKWYTVSFEGGMLDGWHEVERK